jgi:beta-lactamase class A
MLIDRRRSLIWLGAGLCAGTAQPATERDKDLAAAWRGIAAGNDGEVGAAAMHLESGRAIAMNGDRPCLLQSVCKLPIAIHLLALVDEGRFRLNEPIDVLPRDIVRFVSPVADRWPKERAFRLDELLQLMVAQSDNTAVETLYRVGGGSAALAARFRQWRVNGMRVDRSEAQCGLDRAGIVEYPPQSEWNDKTFEGLMAHVDPKERARAVQRSLTDPRDTGTPNATIQLLARVYRGEILSKTSTARLVEILRTTTTGPRRLKGLLPEGTVVGHKTGSSGTHDGFTPSTNDAGVITLPGGRGLLAIAVYVKASTRDEATRDGIIAKIARAAYDFWMA